LSIETLLDLETMSVEELVGRLKAAEERHDLSGTGNNIARLNLTEEELVARISKRLQIGGGGDRGQSSGGSSGSRGGRGRGGGRGGGRGAGARKKGEGTGRGDNNSGDVASDQCRYCGNRGHWARDCRKKKRDEAAHLAQAEEEVGGDTLLMARVCTVQTRPGAQAADNVVMPGSQVRGVHLVEGRVFAQFGSDGTRADDALDTGATNHMTGSRAVFSEIDENIVGTVQFGDGSVVNIEGRGTVLFSCKSGEHHQLTGVYLIPRLDTNLISVGQARPDAHPRRVPSIPGANQAVAKPTLLHQAADRAAGVPHGEARGCGTSGTATSTSRHSESWQGRAWCAACHTLINCSRSRRAIVPREHWTWCSATSAGRSRQRHRVGIGIFS